MVALDDTTHGARGFGSAGTKQLNMSSPSKDKKSTKKKNLLSPLPRSQPRQVQNSVNTLVGARPGPSFTSGLARGFTNGQEVVSLDNAPGGMIVEVGESTVGVDFSNRAPKQRALELAT